jgi:hypothetical protein
LQEWGLDAGTPEYDATGAQFLLTLPAEQQQDMTNRLMDLTSGQTSVSVVED